MMSDDLGQPALHLVPDEADQVIRLAAFREAHPGVDVGCGDGWWQAWIPEASGETVITRPALRHLLDKLEDLT